MPVNSWDDTASPGDLIKSANWNAMVADQKLRLKQANVKTDVEPVEATNGSRVIFTLPDSYVANSLKVYRAGQRMYRTIDFTETSANSFTMIEAPLTIEELRCDYIVNS